MQRIMRIALSSLLVLTLVGTTAANAQDSDYDKDSWPLSVNNRPLTLAAGMLEISGDTFLFNMSADNIGKPFSLAPDIYYGVDDKLSVGINHGTGICLAGEDKGCAKVYNDLAIDALYGIMLKGSFQLALHGGLGVPFIDPFTTGLNIGARGRINIGNFAVAFDPSLYVGFTKRDALAELVSLPFWAQFQVNEQTMVYAMSGLMGPLDGFGDGYAIPIGAGAAFAINNRIDFGGEFRFDNLAGKDGSADGRMLILRAALRL